MESGYVNLFDNVHGRDPVDGAYNLPGSSRDEGIVNAFMNCSLGESLPEDQGEVTETELTDLFCQPYCDLALCFSREKPCTNVSKDEFANYLYDVLRLHERLEKLYAAGFNPKRAYKRQKEELEKKLPEAPRILAVTILLHVELYELGPGAFDLYTLFIELHENLLISMMYSQSVRLGLDGGPARDVEGEPVFRHGYRYFPSFFYEMADGERDDILALVIRKYDLALLIDLFMSLEQDDFCRYCGADILDLLLEKNYPFDWHSLYAAASKELNVYAVRRFLERGVLQQEAPADWDDRPPIDFYGFTSFNVEIMNLFMAYGANPRAIDSDGNTVLNYFLSMQDPDVDCLETLINYGVDASIPDKDANYPIIYAIKTGYDVSIIKLLLATGADVNCMDSKGCTPLQYAVDNDEMTTFLLSAGATNYGEEQKARFMTRIT
jgi:hypothetical protein